MEAIARERGATLAMIDTSMRGRELFLEASQRRYTSSGKGSAMAVYLNSLQDAATAKGFTAFTSSLEDDLVRSVRQHLAVELGNNIAGFTLARSVVGDSADQLAMALVSDSLCPEGMDAVLLDGPEERHEANALRERVMCDRILALCRGAMSRGKPRRRVVAVVGRAHVMPLRGMLLAAGAGE